MRSSRAYTLGELLISITILLVLMVTFAFLLSQSRSSSEGGLKNIEVRSAHRTAQQNLTSLVRSAIAPNEVDPAIVSPAYEETAPEVRFHAPANLIDSTLPFNLRAPDYPEFTLRLSSSNGGFVVDRSDGTGARRQFGHGFTAVEFERLEKTALKFTLTSEYEVRGDAGATKRLRASSTNIIRLPGVH